jgi:hypothetical protein
MSYRDNSIEGEVIRLTKDTADQGSKTEVVRLTKELADQYRQKMARLFGPRRS